MKVKLNMVHIKNINFRDAVWNGNMVLGTKIVVRYNNQQTRNWDSQSVFVCLIFDNL